jgi:polysaccharide export outer membrane protein
VRSTLQFIGVGALALAISLSTTLNAQTTSQQKPSAQPGAATNGAPVIPAGVPLPPGYVIGPEDVLNVLFWKDKEMTAEVAVRPDGMISLLLVNDIRAAGLTPDQLREEVTKAAAKYIEDPTVSVVVKQINSRKVYITGQVGKQGAHPLGGPTTVLQMLSVAGGVHEFADTKNILIVRNEGNRPVVHRFNYKDVMRGKNLKQNIELKPGDTIIVP